MYAQAPRHPYWFWPLLCLLWIGTAPICRASASDQVWILVDTQDQQLSVMRGHKPIRVFRGISIGRNGVSDERHKGDWTTPVGRFRIAKINDNSSFHRFFALNYPTPDVARRAFEEGAISLEDYRAIVRASRAHRLPPQDTPLGGHLGIHGLGGGNPRIHRLFNWTEGCVALTNRQIDELTQWAKVGVAVEIR